MIKNVVKYHQMWVCFTCSSRMPSFLASVLMACSITADWLMPSLSARSLRNFCAVSLRRILVFFFVILTVYHKVWYTASTCKPPARAGGVPVVASSARKYACGGWTALAQQCVKRRPLKQVLKCGYTRFTTF